MRATFDAIGTKWSIELLEGDESENAEQGEERALARARERIEFFDRTYSRFRTDSLVTAMSREAGTYELPEDARELIKLYQDLYRATDGAFTPLIGQVLSDAGYDADYSLARGSGQRALSAPPPLDDVIAYEFPTLLLKRRALLDFGAAGKGYLVDLVAEILEQEGIKNFTVNAGGDIRVRTDEKTDKPVRIGLEHPDDPTQVIGIANIREGSICGSAGNRRAWSTYHHIIDPRTLESPKHIKAVWVASKIALIADALATALYFAPPERFAQYDFEYCIVYNDLTLERSSNFPAELFT